MTSVPIMLDVDTGVDDAAAIALALGLETDLVGISTVAGNVPIDLSTGNTLKVLSWLDGAEVPVFRGASKPLVAPYQDASEVHGGNGLGNATLPEPTIQEQEISGPEAIIAMAEEFAGDLVLVTVGPLTNLAIALSLRPRIVEQIAHVVVMGGAYFTPGNITPHAEFNIYVDPEAANQVFAAEWQKITAIGLDVTHQTALTKSHWQAIPESATGAPALMRAISERTFSEREATGFFLHDPLALAVALDASLVGTAPFAVEVLTDLEHRGQTVASSGGKVQVATTVKSAEFLQRFCDALGMDNVEADDDLARAE